VTFLHWVTQWEFDPSVWIGCAIAIGAYRWFPGARWDRRAVLWILGILIIFVALESAIDIVGDNYLFSVHMAQHLILAMVAPPLMILGIPAATVDALLRGPVGRVVRVVISPYFAGPAYFVVLVGWHWPYFFDYALTHPLVHICQHLSFIAVGILFWWAVIVHRPGEPIELGHHQHGASTALQIAQSGAQTRPFQCLGTDPRIAVERHQSQSPALALRPDGLLLGGQTEATDRLLVGRDPAVPDNAGGPLRFPRSRHTHDYSRWSSAVITSRPSTMSSTRNAPSRR